MASWEGGLAAEQFPETRDLLRNIPNRNGMEPLMHSVDELKNFYGALGMDQDEVRAGPSLTPGAASYVGPEVADTLNAGQRNRQI